MKLSLACIAGNAEKYIGRFLDSFGPVADEIVIVRAIGNAEPDGTLDIAAARGCRVGVYANSKANDWPHVDSFAAARQAAFDMSTGDWIMWADMDDVIDPASCRAIRATIEKIEHDQKWDGLWVRYDVPEDGLSVYRERVIRRGRAKWVFPVHENLEFCGDSPIGDLARVERAVIRHDPIGGRGANNERNLRILQSIPEAERTRSQKFHVFQSLRATGKIAESVQQAGALLADPELPVAERYELIVSCGQLASDPATRGHYFLQAVATDPTRREAYGELVLASLAQGDPAKAVGWADSMLAHDTPREWAWNARRKFYGWAGTQLHAMAVRSNNEGARADAIEYNAFKAAGAKISLIHATRGRGKKAYQCKIMWMDRARDAAAVEHIFCFDDDDEESYGLAANRHIAIPRGGGCVAAWNAGASVCHGQLLVQLSDDWVPPFGWDQLILERVGDLTKETVLAVSDGHRTDRLLCMAIMTRARYKAQGHMFHPAFHEAAMFSDNHFTDRAYADGVVIEARDIVFEHQHPAFDHGVQLDATYAAQNAPEKYAKGREIYERLKNLP